jgi:hypothetical protein
VLGLLFLRHAFRRFNDAKTKIEVSLPHFPPIHILYSISSIFPYLVGSTEHSTGSTFP